MGGWSDMATDVQLRSEACWLDEYVPENLSLLGKGIREHYGVGPASIGFKGNRFHLRGYHRSRRWILQSRWSQYGRGDYSIKDPRDRSGPDNAISAIDFQLPIPKLMEACKRLDAAMRADLLPAVREFYGNINGDKIVDGWDDVAHQFATSDPSHLWHCHLSFYRSRVEDDHTDVLNTIIGGPMLTASDESKIRSIVRSVLTEAAPWQSEGVAAWAEQNGWAEVSLRTAVEHVWERTVASAPQVALPTIQAKLEAIEVSPVTDAQVQSMVSSIAAALGPQLAQPVENLEAKVLAALVAASEAIRGAAA